jgi:hypothetical protein
MKAILLITFAFNGLAMATPPMTARFNNGDIINGSLVGIDEESIIWDSDFFTKAHPLKLDRLIDLSLSGNEVTEMPEGDHIAVVTLTNGDIIRGALTSLDKSKVLLSTSYAGNLVFRRDMVSTLSIEDRPEIFYSGPNGLDEWNVADEDDWTFENGELVSHSSASISREIGERDQFRISFDIEWRGNARFRVFVCADDTDLDQVGNSYELVCQSQYAYMRKRTKRNGRTESITIGTTGGVREFQEREKVRVELLHDIVAGRVRFILGGRVVADWREPAPGAGKLGSALHFLSDSGKQIRVSRIRVSSWDGNIDGNWQEEGNDPFEEEDAEDEETRHVQPSGILLRNGDIIKGETMDIENGAVKLKTDLGEFTLPVSRLRSFALRTAEEAANPELTWKPIIRNGDVRAHFTEGDHITFQLIGFSKDTIRGKSPTFGEADFDLSAFNRIEFNLYDSDDNSDW